MPVEQELITLFLNGAIGAVALYVLNRILSSFIESNSKERDGQNMAIQQLVGLIGSGASQMELSRQVINKNNDLIERTNSLIEQMAVLAKSAGEQFARKIDIVEGNLTGHLLDMRTSLETLSGQVLEQSGLASIASHKVDNQVSGLQKVLSELDFYKGHLVPGLIVFDGEGHVLAANHNAFRILNRKEISTTKIFDVIDIDGFVPRERWLPLDRLKQKGHVEITVMGVYNPETGGRDWVTVEARPVMSDTNELARILMFIRPLGTVNLGDKNAVIYDEQAASRPIHGTT